MGRTTASAPAKVYKVPKPRNVKQITKHRMLCRKAHLHEARQFPKHPFWKDILTKFLPIANQWRRDLKKVEACAEGHVCGRTIEADWLIKNVTVEQCVKILIVYMNRCFTRKLSKSETLFYKDIEQDNMFAHYLDTFGKNISTSLICETVEFGFQRRTRQLPEYKLFSRGYERFPLDKMIEIVKEKVAEIQSQ